MARTLLKLGLVAVCSAFASVALAGPVHGRHDGWQHNQRTQSARRTHGQQQRNQAWQQKQRQILQQRAHQQQRQNAAWQRQQREILQRRADQQRRRNVAWQQRPQWSRGQRYQGAWHPVNDWRRRGLNRPPQGYVWINTNNNYLLVATATGLILNAILH